MNTIKSGGKAGRQLDAEARKRRIDEAVEKLSKSEAVSGRDMKNLLSPRQYSDYENRCDYEKFLRQDAKDARVIFEKYHKALRKGDLLDGKGEKYRSNSRLTCKFHAQAEAAYERALETLQETLEKNLGAEIYLDRPMFGAVYGPDKRGVPRVDYSRPFTSKIEVKEAALRGALEAPEEEPEEPPAQASDDKLKELLAKLKKYG